MALVGVELETLVSEPYALTFAWNEIWQEVFYSKFY